MAACLLALVAAVPLAALQDGEPASERVVVLGFSGADFELVQERIAGGALPNLARLAESGSLAPLVPPPPADPVASWAALTTGRNAGETDVFGSMRCERTRGQAVPRPGEIQREWRPTEQYADLPFPRLGDGLPGAFALASLGGLVSLIGFLFVLRGLLRVGLRASLVIGGLMGVVGALAGWTVRSYLPDSIPRVSSPVRAEPLWTLAERAGVSGTILGAPFDAAGPGSAAIEDSESSMRVLAGRGFPDARGERGSWFLYTSNPEEDAPAPRGRALGASGTVFSVREVRGKASSRVFGPDNFAGGEMRASVPLAIERKDAGLEVTLGNTTQWLGAGDGSELYPVSFQLNPLLRVNALARARLSFLDHKHFELLVEPLHIDARAAPFWQRPCRPEEFGEELASAVGPFETCGFAPLDHELWGDAALLSRAELSSERRLEQLRYVLAQSTESAAGSTGESDRLIAAFFEGPGDATSVVPETADEHLDAYQRMDAIVGEVAGSLRAGDLLLVCSDRGGRTPARVWHLNNWLVEKGWLAVRPGSGRGDARVLRFVDWGRTRAFALGSGQIYLHRPGDEPLAAELRAELLDALEADLREARDPKTGAPVARSVLRGSEIYTGPFAGHAPDLVVGLAAPLALSGETWAGGLALEEAPSLDPAPAFAEAREDAPTIGVDPVQAAGFLASSRALKLGDDGVAHSLEFAPTVLRALGVQAEEPSFFKSLLE